MRGKRGANERIIDPETSPLLAFWIRVEIRLGENISASLALFQGLYRAVDEGTERATREG